MQRSFLLAGLSLGAVIASPAFGQDTPAASQDTPATQTDSAGRPASTQTEPATTPDAGAAAAGEAQPASSPASTEDAGLEEIVVTAQKRVENLQDVPISVAAVSSRTV